jgi:hypothetical protein
MMSKPNAGDDSGGDQRYPMNPSKPHELCGAKRRDGQSCQAPAMPNGRCRVHGGTSPAGIAHPLFKHGKRSRYLRDMPRELKAGYSASRKDDELTSIKEELAVQTALIQRRLADLKAQQIPGGGVLLDRPVGPR